MLPLFKKKGDNLWNFRCPYCGDSQKSRTKARGFVFRKKNDLFFKCHNCGVGASLGNLIKYVDSKTYDDYILERYRSGIETRSSPQPEFKFDAPVFKKNVFKSLQSISQLSQTHPARRLVDERKLSELFQLFSKIGLSFNILQNSAISFTVAFDYNESKINRLRKEVSENYKVVYNEGATLITIRHFTEQIIADLLKGRTVLLEQRTRSTARFVLS